MSQCTECNLQMLNNLVEQYLETHSQTVLIILEMLIEQNVHSIDSAILEVLALY